METPPPPFTTTSTVNGVAAPPPGPVPRITLQGVQPVPPTFDPYTAPNAAPPFGQPGPVTTTNPAPFGSTPLYAQPAQPAAPFPQSNGTYLFTQPDGTIGGWQRLLQRARLRYTWVNGSGNNSLDTNTFEVDGTFYIPWFYNTVSPLLITPGFAVHLTSGPNPSVVQMDHPDLPNQLYDAYLDAGWQPVITQRLRAELGARVGIYSDFNSVQSEAFRILGRGYGVFTHSPNLEIWAGVLYVDRLRIKLLPAGGIIYMPQGRQGNSRWEILFPNPKYTQRLAYFGNHDVWWYAAGEYGGGSWSIERDPTGGNAGANDEVDINDLRVSLGLECTSQSGIHVFVEGGYVFEREMIYRSGIGNFNPKEAFMVRAGIWY